MSETPIADEIRSEAVISTRPGQADRLTDLADRVARLERGGKTLGEMVVFWQNLAVEVTESQDCIGPDGDGDWAAVTERLMELAPTKADQCGGPEHYREAERLLEEADRDVSSNWSTQTGEHKADILAAAQVHATLALVGATERTSVTFRPICPECFTVRAVNGECGCVG